MAGVRVIEVKQSVFADNDRRAAQLRERLKARGTFLLNLMSSPGAGKTSLLLRTTEALGDELPFAVMEADIDSDVDARTMKAAGVRTIQLHTGGMCHLDAQMTEQGLEALLAEIEAESSAREVAAAAVEAAPATSSANKAAAPGVPGAAAAADDSPIAARSALPPLVVLENVGNLVCPAEFDTGACANAMILSVPEGDDKPLKYPLMFQVCDVVLINKIDTLPAFKRFSMDRVRENILMRNPNATIIPVSAETGEGIDQWATWLKETVGKWSAGISGTQAPGTSEA